MIILLNRQGAKGAKKSDFEPPRRQDAKKSFLKFIVGIAFSVKHRIHTFVVQIPQTVGKNLGVLGALAVQKILASLASWRFKSFEVFAVHNIKGDISR
jgi:hypothetical protein